MLASGRTRTRFASLPTSPTPARPRVIRFENVTSTYPGHSKPALVDVSVAVARGEFVFLVGESGSGKSTFLRLVLRETRTTQGHVVVADKDRIRRRSWKVPGLRRQI